MKKKCIVSSALILVSALTGVLYSFTNVINISNIKINEFSIIAHAGGGLDGVSYLNSKEAFYYHYNNGTRIFEYDFVLSYDEEVITSHKWESNVIGGEWDSNNRPTLDQFNDIKIAGKYTGITIYTVMDLMESYDDIMIIIDSKDELHGPLGVYEKIVETVSEYNHELLERMTPFLYSLDMLEQLKNIHNFENHIFILDAFNNFTLMSNRQIVNYILNNNSVSGLMVSHFRLRFIPSRYIKELNKAGKNVYTYTINKEKNMVSHLNKGVSGFVSDVITQDRFNEWIINELKK